MKNGKCGKGWEPGFGGKCVRSKKKRTIGQAIGGVASKVFPHKNIDKSYKWNSKKTGKIAAAAGIATVGGGLLGLVSSSRRGQKGGRDEWDRLVNSSEKQKERVSRKLRTDRKSPGKCGKGWELGSGGKCIRPRPKSDKKAKKLATAAAVTGGLGVIAGAGLIASKDRLVIKEVVDPSYSAYSAAQKGSSDPSRSALPSRTSGSFKNTFRYKGQKPGESADDFVNRFNEEAVGRSGKRKPGESWNQYHERAQEERFEREKEERFKKGEYQPYQAIEYSAWNRKRMAAVEEEQSLDPSERVPAFRQTYNDWYNELYERNKARKREERFKKGKPLGVYEEFEYDQWLKSQKKSRKDSLRFRGDRKSPGKCGKGWEPGPGGKCIRPRPKSDRLPTSESKKDPAPPDSPGKGVNPRLLMSGIGLTAGLGLMAYGAYDAHKTNQYIRKQVDERMRQSASRDWWTGGAGAGSGTGGDASGTQDARAEYQRRYEEARRRAQERERTGQQAPPSGRNSGPSFSRAEAQSWWAKNGSGGAATRQSMRKARKAAWAKVHPDAVQDPKEKARRTAQFRKVSDEFENAARAMGINLDSVIRLRRDRQSRGGCGKGWTGGVKGKCARAKRKWTTLGLKKREVSELDGFLSKYERRQDSEERLDAPFGGKCGRGWEPGPGGKCVRSRGGISKKLLAGAAIAGAAGTLGGVAYLAPKIGRVYNERNQLRKQNSQQRQENQKISEQKRAAEVRAAGAEERAKIQQGIVSAKEAEIQSQQAKARDQSNQFAVERQRARSQSALPKRTRVQPRQQGRNVNKPLDEKRYRDEMSVLYNREAAASNNFEKVAKAVTRGGRAGTSLKGKKREAWSQAIGAANEATDARLAKQDERKRILARRQKKTSVRYVGDSMLTQENFDFISQEVSASHGIKIDDVYHLEERRDGVSGIASCGGDFFEFDITSRSVSITDREDLTEAADQRARGALASRGLAYRGDSAFEYLRGMETRLDAPRVGGKCGRGWEPGPGGKCVRSKGRLGMAGKIGLGVAGLAAAGGIAYANRDRIANSQVGQQARKMAGQVKQKASAAYDRAANSKYGQKAQQVAGKIQGKAQAAADRVANSRYGRKAQQVAGQVEGQARSIYRQARGEAGKVKRGIESAVGSGMNRVANSSVGQKAQRVAGRVEGQARSAYRQARGEAGKAKRSVESTVASGMNRVANSKYGRKARTELGRAKRQVQSTVDQGVQMGRRGAQKVKRQVRRVVS